MFEVKVENTFSAAHRLRNYSDSKCESLHGHNWKVEIIVAGKNLDKVGMLLDFKILKEKLNKVLSKLDHKYLNNLDYFKKKNPTAENIAKYIFLNLKKEIPNLKRVNVWESQTSEASYYEK